MAVTCKVCPNQCHISDNHFGICGVRGALDNKLHLPYHGILSATSVDPIEKKPLYHFHPGAGIYSVGFFGCSLSCPFCQNYRISKEFPRKPEGRKTRPESVAEAALKSGSFGIAYTYSEPIVHYEWVLECAKEAHARGLKNVLVTNGYINDEPAKELLAWMDAVNIDLKSFNESFYHDELGGSLRPVLDFIRLAADSVHTELTTLIIPGKNDSTAEINKAADFIAGIDKNIPWHLSAYYPAYKYSIRPTGHEEILKLVDTAGEKLNFVFAGNIGGRSDTYCPSCGSLLIKRSGYSTIVSGIAGGRCTGCGSDAADFNIIIDGAT
ncbi:MAG TPA: AmmeMemoRadiSam system radical SAM enzyme [Spirochaeta sp.]|nr:AmmeMemoRadiSam system radical SAM enzyme [Spirochaeta sp.]